MRFQVGDIVRLAKNSSWIHDSKTEGIITSVANPFMPIIVNWYNGVTHFYNEEDLKLVRRPSNEFKKGE